MWKEFYEEIKKIAFDEIDNLLPKIDTNQDETKQVSKYFYLKQGWWIFSINPINYRTLNKIEKILLVRNYQQDFLCYKGIENGKRKEQNEIKFRVT